MTNLKNDTKPEKNNHKPGTSNNPITNYTINDCLTPHQVAQKFNISTERVRKIMHLMEENQESVLLNGHYKPAIVSKSGSSTKRLHPIGFTIFKQYNEKRIK